VTQDNQGKKTAGIDGVKNLMPPQRLTLAETLTLKPKAKPTRRVWIPKPGTTEKRGLGIPIRADLPHLSCSAMKQRSKRVGATVQSRLGHTWSV
jgi:hypothetical protein